MLAEGNRNCASKRGCRTFYELFKVPKRETKKKNVIDHSKGEKNAYCYDKMNIMTGVRHARRTNANVMEFGDK